MVVVQVVSSAKTKDKFLAACFENIWLISAVLDKDMKISHMQGKVNVVADLLPRFYSCNEIDHPLLSHPEEHLCLG